jgi:hypothetical protein
MVQNIFIPFMLLILACSCNGFFKDKKLENKDIILGIKSVYSSKDKNHLKLLFTFKSNKDTTICFDNRIFCNIWMFTEQPNLITDCKKDIFCIFRKICNSELIIENQKGEMRFYSEDPYYFTHNIEGTSPTFILNEDIKLKTNDSISFYSNNLRNNALKIHKNDTLIRLFYLFKADSLQKSLGYHDLIIASQWFNILDNPE